MEFLDRNILPKFQERLDLASSDLNAMEDIYVEAINEIAGRFYIIINLIPIEERDKYAEEVNSLLLDTIDNINSNIDKVEENITKLFNLYEKIEKELNLKYTDLEKRLNTLDDAAARKEDLAVLYKRFTNFVDTTLNDIEKALKEV